MPLAKKEYKSYDALILALKASPVCTILKFLLSVTQSIMQTAVMAVATANFVDTAAEILIMCGRRAISICRWFYCLLRWEW